MGAYLSEPITKKISSDESGKNVAFGASSMQGWRVSQEDAHNCCIEFDDDCSLFAVYDGHGGHEVATYCAKELPAFIKNTEAYKSGNIKQALIDAFLGFDASLTKPDIVNILKGIAGTNHPDKEKQDSCCSDDEESVTDLRMEAAMPLEQVMARYHSEFTDLYNRPVDNPQEAQTRPYLRCRRDREKTSNRFAAGAGCSTSSSSSTWNPDEQNVSSSSSQPCSSSAATTSIEDEISKRPDRDEKLDSTTSNGQVDHSAAESVSSTAVGAAQSTKSPDIPDSSGDVAASESQKSVVPPAIVAKQPQEVPKPADLNGGAKEEPNESVVSNADSKTSGDNVTSSSSSSGPAENGEGQIEEIISCQRRITPTPVVDLYKSLLQNDKGKKLDKRNDNDNEDDDDENDETFDGLPAGSDQDSDDDMVDDDDSSSAQLDDEDDDEDDDDDDDEDEADDEKEGDDDDGDLTMDMTEEPGSDSGCTAVVAVLHGKNLYVANAGDSRCVICRDGDALELSLDHKPEDQPEMERIVKAGGKVTADGRVNGGLNLSRALGDHAYKQNTKLPAQEQMISALPDVRHIAVEPERDEFMILACDGIWNFMSSQEVVKFVRPRLANLQQGNISKICEELFDHCLAPHTLGDGTGCDNMTAVIVKFNWSKSSDVAATADQQSVTKKRPISPNTLSSPSDDCSAEKDSQDAAAPATSNDSTKRLKTDSV